MQKPEVILDILYKRSSNNLAINHIYKNLYNPEWYYIEDKDKYTINDARISNIISNLRYEKYKWVKLNNTLPSYKQCAQDLQDDIVLTNIIQKLLTSIYEPIFSDHCHSYREDKGIHTALARVYQKGQACEFFITGNLSTLYKDIDHKVFLSILSETIKDGRMLEIMRKFLKANKYNKDFIYDKSYSGVPISKGISGLLLNIYLSKLDKFILDSYQEKYNKEKVRPVNPEYLKISNRIGRLELLLKKNDDDNIKKQYIQELKELRKQRDKLRNKIDINHTTFRRFTYTRYAAEFIISFTGTFDEANLIKKELESYIYDIYNINSTIDISAAIGSKKYIARFLNHNVIIQYDNTKKTNGVRSLVGTIAFLIPHDILTEYKRKYCQNDKPIHLSSRLNLDDEIILRLYQREAYGICQYYIFARNKKVLSSIKYIMQVSLMKTLANKFKVSCNVIHKRYQSSITIKDQSYKVLQKNNIYFGAIPLKSQTPSKFIIIEDYKSNRL